MDFQALKSNLKKDFSDRKFIKLAILSDSASQFLTMAIRGYGYEAGYHFEVYEADYDQLENEILDPSSGLYQFNPEYILIFNTTRKKLGKFYHCSEPEKAEFADHEIATLRQYYDAMITQNPACKILYANLPETHETVFGNYANKVTISFEYQLRKFNYELMNLSQELGNLYVNDLCLMQSQCGAHQFFDQRMYVTADMAYGLEALPLIAKNSIDIINAVSGQFKKCLILDLDHTLWGGVIGDDGIENIEIGSLGIGKVYSEFQLWIKQLKERGIILAVCSQNHEQVAKSPFSQHPEMILKLEDISIFVANWDSKAENIKYIQSVLNIGFNSMVFLDDDAYQRNLVRTYLPEITVPELPKDPADYLSYLMTLNLFETANYSKEDKDRSKYYQEEMDRLQLKKAFTTDTDYLNSLEMSAEILNIDAFTLPRIAQLIQRSNQFNVRTIRYSEEQLLELVKDPNTTPMAFSLKDRFGSYGVISVVILKNNQDHLFIDSWLMSCRVLRRGVEDLVLNCIVNAARNIGSNKLVGEFIPSSKNSLVENHYQTMGFKFEGGKWHLGLDEHTPKPYFIQIKEWDQNARRDNASN
jgi:FkbH-like protein